MALQGFDKDYYLQAKLDALVASGETEWVGKDADFLETVLVNVYGLTPEDHYSQYGYAEGLAPNAYFNAAEYTLAKATQLFNAGLYLTIEDAQADYEAKWPGDDYQHYLQYGSAEGINPSNAFDESSYLDSKLAALQADPDTSVEWADKTADDVQAAFTAAGLTVLGHYIAYGQDEGIAVTPVPADEQVDVDTSLGVVGETFILTTGLDNVVGTADDDTIVGLSDGSDNTTLTLGDVINGGAGTDTLNINTDDDYELNLAVADISNVEQLYVKNLYDNFDELNVAGNAFDTVTVDYAGTEHDNDLYIDNIDGQTDLVIDNVVGYNGYSFYRNYDEVYDQTEGTVSVSNTIRNFDAVTQDYYSYFEGYNYFSVATEINHTFNLDTVDGGDEGFDAEDYIGTKVDGAVINSTINITDAVTPDSYSEIYVYVDNETDEASDVTAVVNITDSDGIDFEFDTYNSGDSGTSDEITYNLDNLANTYGYNYLYTYAFETINVNVLTDSEVYELYDEQTDGNDQTINIVADGNFMTDYTYFEGDVGDVTLNVSGAGDVDLGDAYLGDGDADDTVTVDATALTGDFTMTDDSGYINTIESGAGDDDITIAAFTTTVDTGAGDDTVDTAGLDFADDDAETIDGGAGTDTVAIIDNSLIDADFMANIVNFETLEIAGAINVGNYDMDIMGFTDIKLTNTAIAAATGITNAAADAALTFTATNAFDATVDLTAAGLSYALEDATGTSDSLSITLNANDTDEDQTAEGQATVAFTANDIETVNVESNATTASEESAAGEDDALTEADYVNVVTVSADSATRINITGGAQADVTIVSDLAVNEVQSIALTDDATNDGTITIGGVATAVAGANGEEQTIVIATAAGGTGVGNMVIGGVDTAIANNDSIVAIGDKIVANKAAIIDSNTTISDITFDASDLITIIYNTEAGNAGVLAVSSTSDSAAFAAANTTDDVVAYTPPTLAAMEAAINATDYSALVGTGAVVASGGTVTLTYDSAVDEAEAGVATTTGATVPANATEVTKGVGASVVDIVDATGNTAGVDVDVTSSIAGVTFNGSEADDTYTASTNGDTIQANAGADVIFLGGGDDTVRYISASDSQLTLEDTSDPADDEMDTATGFDVISDFGSAGTDIIELSSLLGLAGGDARSDMLQLGTITSGGNSLADDLDTFIGDGVDFFDTGLVDRAVAFADDAVNGDGWIFIDANSDGDFTQADDMVINLAGVTTLAITDISFG